MTNGHLTPQPNPILYYEARQKREQRRKQFDAVRAKRKIISTRFYQKTQAQSQATWKHYTNV